MTRTTTTTITPTSTVAMETPRVARAARGLAEGVEEGVVSVAAAARAGLAWVAGTLAEAARRTWTEAIRHPGDRAEVECKDRRRIVALAVILEAAAVSTAAAEAVITETEEEGVVVDRHPLAEEISTAEEVKFNIISKVQLLVECHETHQWTRWLMAIVHCF